ncbi:flavodoxin domain-containing protein [Lacrimispora celerecrescens]|uniref:flavodoxin domain-containing protein n=1 Tax=Lacrimispora celerecrescens TaxID=29354 RepID=UPI001646EA61|nr:flavodoxin domain-containing protein [Lacrimispora celerecrescens]
MNTIIVYSSKYGCAADCATLLKSGLPGTVELVSINEINSKPLLLDNFDTVILGSSIYVGTISKKMRAFCIENVGVLSRKRVGIFLCCALPAQINEYLSKNFPAALLESAVVIKDFGGEARIGKLKGINKIIMKAALKDNFESLKISHEHLESFIKEISM